MQQNSTVVYGSVLSHVFKSTGDLYFESWKKFLQILFHVCTSGEMLFSLSVGMFIGMAYFKPDVAQIQQLNNFSAVVGGANVDHHL